MVNAADRRRRLLDLLREPPHWTGAALAEQLGVTTRTVRTDIEQLRSLDYDIDACRGMGGGYRLRTANPRRERRLQPDRGHHQQRTARPTTY